MFTDHNWYWLWGCWIAPLIGSVIGAGLYDLFIFTGGESPINYQYQRLWREQKDDKDIA